MKTSVFLAALVLVLVAMSTLTMYTVNKMSVTSKEAGTVTVDKGVPVGTSGISAELFGKAATLGVAAYDDQADTTTQVATTGYYWINDKYGGTLTLSASARVNIADAVVGDTVKVIAFDSTYPYGKESTFTVVKQGDLVNLFVSKASTSQSVTFFNENGDIVTDPTGAGITVGATNYVMDKLRLANSDDKSMFKAYLLSFDYVDTSNITEIKVSGLSKYTGVIGRQTLKTAEDYYVMQADLNDAATRFDSGSVTIVPNGNNIHETITVRVSDWAPFIKRDKTLAFGFENDAISPADVGITDVSQTLVLA